MIRSSEELDSKDFYIDKDNFSQKVEDRTTQFVNYDDYTDAVDMDVEIDHDFYRDNQ